MALWGIDVDLEVFPNLCRFLFKDPNLKPVNIPLDDSTATDEAILKAYAKPISSTIIPDIERSIIQSQLDIAATLVYRMRLKIFPKEELTASSKQHRCFTAMAMYIRGLLLDMANPGSVDIGRIYETLDIEVYRRHYGLEGPLERHMTESTDIQHTVTERIIHGYTQRNSGRYPWEKTPDISFPQPVNMWTSFRKSDWHASTTVQWEDGTKTTVVDERMYATDEFSGFCACLAKKLFGSTTNAVKAMEKAKDNAKPKETEQHAAMRLKKEYLKQAENGRRLKKEEDIRKAAYDLYVRREAEKRVQKNEKDV